MKKTGIYKAANVTFDPVKVQAYSYAWWKFVDIVEGKVIFNNYYYSPSTCKHQYKVKRLMSELGIQIDIEMPLPQGILKTGDTSYHHGTVSEGISLEQMILEAEEYLCEKISLDIIKQQERNEKAKQKRLESKSPKSHLTLVS